MKGSSTSVQIVGASQKNTSRNLPEKKFRAGAISATVWKNSGQSKQGENVEFRTISLERAYKNQAGEWQHTTSLRLNDVPRACVALQKAYEYLVFREQDVVVS